MTPPGSAAQAGQVDLYQRFVNKENAHRYGFDERTSMSEPLGTLLPYLGAVALGGHQPSSEN